MNDRDPHDPRRTSRLIEWISRALARRGGRVLLGPELDNLVRRCPPDADVGSNVRFVVESQGLPNLLHELFHAAGLGRLEDDHGFDYGRIPCDVAAADGRRTLFDELCCCTLSCAWTHDVASPGGRGRIDAWYAEQVEIQPVFYGHDERPEAFVRVVSAVVAGHAPELRAMCRLLDARARAWLRVEGAPVGELVGERWIDPVEQWLRYARGSRGSIALD